MKESLEGYDDSINYCGPQNWFGRTFVKRKWFGVDFNKSCFLHDGGYDDSDRRKDEDIKFLRHMKKMVDEQQPQKKLLMVVWGSKAVVNKEFHNPYHYLAKLMAHLYFIAVRVGGWKHINLTGTPEWVNVLFKKQKKK